MRFPFASLLIADIAPELGIAVELEPEFKFAGELIFPNGRRRVFRNTNFNINPAGSAEIAKDKGYTKYFLRKAGMHVPEGQAFFSQTLNANLPAANRRGIAEALDYAHKQGYPLYIKPNNLSQGRLVVKVYNESRLVEMAAAILEKTQVFLLEEPCPGRDYRVVVLGDNVISAYERVALAVQGDGVSSVAGLLSTTKLKLSESGRPNSEIDLTDVRIDIKLESGGLSRDSIIPDGRKLPLLDNANLSTGGNSMDVTDSIHPGFAEIAVKACRALSLRFAGIDILCADISAEPSRQIWNVIEVNAAPGLDNYAALGAEQAGRVRQLYQAILEYMALEE
jgi:D-alanine-D-alanine ligase-like ATP-grasp enzyme